MKFFKKVLSNGLTIVEVPSQDAESVVVDFFIKTGSRSENAKENGISHFLEHFLFKGSKKYPSALAISSLIDAIGGEMNANTGKEHTQFYIKTASKHLPLIFEVLTDMLKNPLFDPLELEKEKGVIVEEINMYKDTPMYEIENILEKEMWPKDPLGRSIAGTKETVKKFDQKMFQRYIGAHYQPSNIILGISGKYSQKHFSELVRKNWSILRQKVTDGWKKSKDSQNSLRAKIEYKKTEQAHLSLGFKGFAYNDSRNTAQLILSVILGGGMSSRLFTEVREKRGLAYYISASGSNFQDTGIFNVRAGVPIDKIQGALKVIISELVKVKREEVREDELKKAKEYVKGRTVLALEDNQARLDWFLERAAFYKKIETPKQMFGKIDAVSSLDVQKAARDLFKAKKLTLAVIGPYRNKKLFNKLINID